MSESLSSSEVLNLHIGGKEIHPDWKIFDIEDRPEVDFVGDASDMSQFADNSVDNIYASHVLEHFHYKLNDELPKTLAEWYRVLKPGGHLLISVPDIRTLCWLYLSPDSTFSDRYQIMRMMFGGHMNEYDIHRTGFDVEILEGYISQAGFSDYEPVPEFNIFNDTSSLRFWGHLISLNVVATK